LEYEALIHQHFGESIASDWLKGEVSVAKAYGPFVTLYESGLYLRFIETESEIVILGLISESGKLNRIQAVALVEWLNELRSKILSGKTILCNLNLESHPILLRVFRGLGFNFEVLDVDRTDRGAWVGLKFWLPEHLVEKKEQSPSLVES
jgi:hypothetical protein